MELNHINNVNKNLQKKMRFFADYFSFANEYLGRLPQIPFDNQLSLIDKCIFQIENNFENCFLYVIDYLTELFTFHKHYFENSTLSTLQNVEKKFKELKITKGKKEWIIKNPDFLENLKLLSFEYADDSYFERNCLAIMNYIKCPHTIEKHKKEIEYRTQVMVSQFRFKGHTKESLDTYISRIISQDEYKFPFPQEIIKVKSKELYKISVKEFLNKSDFDKQFKGLINLFIADQHKIGYFFFVIENCIIDSESTNSFKITFDQVTFISPFHSDLRRLRKSIKNHDKENSIKTYPIFFGKNKILAYIKMGYENKDSTKNKAFNIISEELIIFNQYDNQETLTANNLHYLFYDSFDNDLWSSSVSLLKVKKARIGKFDLDSLKGNTYEKLRNNTSTAKAIILQNEKVFLKAFSRDEIEYFWIFIENTFEPLNFEIPKIQKGFVQILLKLLNELKIEMFFKIGNMLTPFSFNYKEENLELEDCYLIHQEIFTNNNYNFDLYQYKENINSIVLKDLLENHKTFTSLANEQQWKKYFSSLLIDLYAYRNALVHSGKIDKYSKIKLSSILPRLMSRARWLIINHCNKNQNMEYSELINSLTK